MKLYRFIRRGYMDGRIIEPGDEALVADDVIPGDHMIDVAAEAAALARGETLPEPPPPASGPTAVFRSDLAHDVAASMAPVEPAAPAAPVAPIEPAAPAEPAAPVEQAPEAPAVDVAPAPEAAPAAEG